MSRILLADDSPHAQRMGERILREEGFEVVTVTDGETALIRLADVEADVIMADVFLPHKSGYELCEYVKNHPRYRHARVVLLAGLLEPVDETEARRVSADGVLKKPFEPSAMVAMVRPLAEAAQLSREAAEFEVIEGGKTHAAALDAAPELQVVQPDCIAPALIEAPSSAAPDPAVPNAVSSDSGIGSSLPAAAGPVLAPAAELEETAEPEPSAGLVEIDPERIRAAVTIALDRAMPAMIDEITERVLVALGR